MDHAGVEDFAVYRSPGTLPEPGDKEVRRGTIVASRHSGPRSNGLRHHDALQTTAPSELKKVRRVSRLGEQAYDPVERDLGWEQNRCVPAASAAT